MKVKFLSEAADQPGEHRAAGIVGWSHSAAISDCQHPVSSRHQTSGRPVCSGCGPSTIAVEFTLSATSLTLGCATEYRDGRPVRKVLLPFTRCRMPTYAAGRPKSACGDPWGSRIPAMSGGLRAAAGSRYIALSAVMPYRCRSIVIP
jgi:hypothetical protein